MPALTDLRPFLRHVESLQHHEPANFLPFMMAGVEVGLVHGENVGLLESYPDLFEIGATIIFKCEGDAEARTAALGRVVDDLGAQGLINLRHEHYPIAAGWGEEVLATIDRAAYQFFGTPGFGVHVNGVVNKPDGPYLWVGRRARDRAVAPGKLDHIVAGGLTAGYTAEGVLIKESYEEAGLSPEIAARAMPAGLVSCTYDVPRGVKRDTLFVYDLFLPEDIVPANTDGEVEGFELMPMPRVIDLIRDTDEFKLNVNAVIIDMLIRHGHFTPDMPGYERLVSGLRRSVF